MVTIDLADGGHLDRPHSVWAVLFLPITLAAFLAAVVITALIATILFSPVVLVWLAVYLSALWWLGRARPHALVQIFAVALAPLLWIVFVQNDPPEVGYRSPGHIPLRNVRPAAERIAGSRALAQWPSVNARALGGHRASRLPVVYASRFRQHA